MITEKERNYLENLPAEEAYRIIYTFPYKVEIHSIAESIMNKIKNSILDAEVRFMGASALGISGQNDIDLYVLAPTSLHAAYLEKLNILFGEQVKHKWHWMEQDYEVSVYLADPADPNQKRQTDMFNHLKDNAELLGEYESLKSSMNGKTYKEYQIAKYEFYNRVLGVEA